MKPTVVADEMFPEGAGPFMELDEVNIIYVTICAKETISKHI